MDKNFILFYMGVVVPACVVFPFIPAVIRYRNFPTELRILSWFLLVDFLANCISSLLGMNGINNMAVMHIYTFVEFAILSYFYHFLFADKRISHVIAFTVVLFFVASLVNALFFQNIYTFNSYTKSIEALLVSILAITLFARDLDSIGGNKRVNAVMAYANTGILIYFSGSFIWFAVCNLMPSNSMFAWYMWALHATLLLVFYVLTAVTLWKYKK